jgi:hypothetical protein
MSISQFPLPSTTPNIGGVNYDAVDKLRVSTPQALIDTDFEYGIQPTKWETLSLQNNRQSCFYDPSAPLTFTGISGAGTRIVTVLTTTPPTVGSVVYIQNATDFNANGWFYVDTVSAGVSFTYTTIITIPAGSIFDPDRTYIWQGAFFSGCGLLLSSTTAFTYSGTTITCTTAAAHGLEPNNNIYV